MYFAINAFALSGRLHDHRINPRVLPWALRSLGFQPADADFGI